MASAAAIAVVAPAAADATTAPTNAPAKVTGRPGVFTGVAALGPHAVWAVGYHNPLSSKFVLWHRTKSWHLNTATPKVGTAFLDGVAGSSPHDVWAVGQGIAMHWTGSKWTRSAIPLPFSEAEYHAVDTLSPTNAWAVGDAFDDGAETNRTLIAHWNGHTWSLVGGAPRGPELDAVSFSGPNDGWAMGTTYTAPAARHWNGTSWVKVAVPAGTSRTVPGYFGVAAVSKADAWAVGSALIHWNGTKWNLAKAPKACSHGNAIAAPSAGNIWSVGRVVCHFSGSGWKVVPSPLPSGATLTGVRVLAPDNVWAVGSRGGTGQETLVLMHWNGSAWHLA